MQVGITRPGVTTDHRHQLCLFAGHERLAAAHRNNAYRCFLPDLTRFTPSCCAGPLAACNKAKTNADTGDGIFTDIIHLERLKKCYVF